MSDEFLDRLRADDDAATGNSPHEEGGAVESIDLAELVECVVLLNRVWPQLNSTDTPAADGATAISPSRSDELLRPDG